MKKINHWNYCCFVDSKVYRRIRLLFLIFIIMRSMFLNEFILAQKFDRGLKSRIVLKQNENEIKKGNDLFNEMNFSKNNDSCPLEIKQESFWNWLNPKPQGNDLRSLWVFDENSFIAIGAFATCVSSDNQGDSIKVQYNIAGQSNLFSDIVFTTGGIGFSVGEQGKILRTDDRGQNWYLVSSPTTKSLNGIAFATDSIGVIVAERGNMFRTVDAGYTWQALPIITQLHLYDVEFISENVGLAVGRSVALITVDAGLTWNVLTNAPLSDVDLYSICYRDTSTAIITGGGWSGGEVILQYNLNNNLWDILQAGQLPQDIFTSISFADKNNGVVVGTRGLIYYSSNQGLTWQQASIANSANSTLTKVSLFNNGVGYTVGFYGSILFTNDYGHTWINLTQSITSNFLTGISFTNSLEGFAVGDAATIIHTSDGGKSWVQQTLPGAGESDHFHGLSFTNPLIGNAVGVFGLIARTTTGGTSWTWQQARSGDTLFLFNFYAVDLIDANNGLLVGAYGLIFKTTNGGGNWFKVRGLSEESLFGVQFLNNSLAFAVGSNGTILISTDGGFNWTKQIGNTSETLWSVHFVNNNLGFVVGSNGTILKTTNSGVEWFPQVSSTTKHLYSVWASDENTIFAFGVKGEFIKSTNGGLSWTVLTLPTDNSIRGVFAFNRDSIIVSGGGGTILSTHVGGGPLSIEDTENKNELNYFLYQNYPNPFNPVTTIVFSLPYEAEVSLRIYNSLGQMVAEIFVGLADAGYHSFQWNGKTMAGEDAASGVYFYNLIVKNTLGRNLSSPLSKTGKMILLR